MCISLSLSLSLSLCSTCWLWCTCTSEELVSLLNITTGTTSLQLCEFLTLPTFFRYTMLLACESHRVFSLANAILPTICKCLHGETGSSACDIQCNSHEHFPRVLVYLRTNKNRKLGLASVCVLALLNPIHKHYMCILYCEPVSM